jgi:uncharacterized protein
MDFDCQACGACCQASNGYGKHYVRLSAEDMQRLTTSQKRLHTVTIEESYGATGAMSLKGNRKTCSALCGEVGVEVSCEIYENRPNVCRSFVMGDDCCLLAREEAGLGEFE